MGPAHFPEGSSSRAGAGRHTQTPRGQRLGGQRSNETCNFGWWNDGVHHKHPVSSWLWQTPNDKDTQTLNLGIVSLPTWMNCSCLFAWDQVVRCGGIHWSDMAWITGTALFHHSGSPVTQSRRTGEPEVAGFTGMDPREFRRYVDVAAQSEKAQQQHNRCHNRQQQHVLSEVGRFKIPFCGIIGPLWGTAAVSPNTVHTFELGFTTFMSKKIQRRCLVSTWCFQLSRSSCTGPWTGCCFWLCLETVGLDNRL